METNDEIQNDPLVEEQEEAAAAEAGAIGGEVASYTDDPAMQPVEESGGGEAEGFEQAERALIENATHGDGAGDPALDAIDNENVEAARSTAAYGEADEVDVTEVTSDPDEPDGPGEGTPIAPDR